MTVAGENQIRKWSRGDQEQGETELAVKENNRGRCLTGLWQKLLGDIETRERWNTYILDSKIYCRIPEGKSYGRSRVVVSGS